MDDHDRGLTHSLTRALSFLFDESGAQHAASCRGHNHHHHHHAPDVSDYIANADPWHQLQTLRALLCQRPAVPELPADVLDHLDRIFRHRQQRRLLLPTAAVRPLCRVPSDAASAVNISLWRGDITALDHVTAIVNAANSAMLGCFKPAHRCIDNVIHSVAGPRLRLECNRLMVQQGYPEPTGTAKVTPGFCATAQWILHTVGPQLEPGQDPTDGDKQDLANCYSSCLDAAEKLSPLLDGRLVIAFPCISTGVFCFPAGLAAQIAVETVAGWCQSHPKTALTDVIFDVFSEADEAHYRQVMGAACDKGLVAECEGDVQPSIPQPANKITPALQRARDWVKQADYLLITAGAGLSAATGLSYTSQSLFRKHFPGFLRLGLRRLYDVFGYDEWPSKAHKWGYYFSHLQMVRSWPKSPLYASLLDFAAGRFDDRFFVRTSNADGLFVANGFPVDRFSSPQGAYKYFQCVRNCRPDAYFLSEPFLDAALPFLDPKTQILTDESKIPACKYCGGELFLCVRAGNFFNEQPFEEGEQRYQAFLDQVENEEKTLAILELGVGLNTPGVLRWPDEELVRYGEGRVRLIRGGQEAAGVVDFELEEEGAAIAIDGDVGELLAVLQSDRD